jgi:hypothetical protein
VKAFLLAFVGALTAVTWANPIPFKRIFAPSDRPSNVYERPFRQGISLNGRWDFQPVANDLPAPVKDGWEKTKVKVPSPWNVNAFPVESRLGGDFRAFPSYPETWEKVQAGWLRRSFPVGVKTEGKRLILRFDAVAGDTRILINGKEVARHFDIFLPFEVDITDAVHRGENELLVGVRKASLTDVQGKYGRRTYQGGSMWGQAIAGIWQDVTLFIRPAVRVDEVFVKPEVAKGVLVAEVTLRNDSDSVRRVQVTGDVFSWVNQAGKSMLEAPEPTWALGAKALSLGPRSVVVPAHGSVTVDLSGNGSKLKPWAPGSPNLYTLACRIDRDLKTTRFGWRQLTFKGTKVLLNGRPLIMRGDSWHFLGIPQMTRRYAWAWFKTLQDAGLNAVRLHAQPYPSFYLDMADEMGILVLDETAVWASDGGPKLDDPGYWADTQRHLTDLIHRDRNHPSVFGWSVSNEVMAVVRNVFHAPKEVEEQADRMNGIWAAICRKEDPTRVWISADGEEDGNGQLPVSIIHYGDRSTMNRAIARSKPWGVGEAGPAYYGSPKQIAEMAKDSGAYLSFADRMRGVAKVSYESLKDQNELGGSYRSVFNLVWYGLKPLELGLADTTRPPTLSDGISFPPFVEGQPGVQPERLGPYCSTLNPGYDPRLPLYATWPLFDAIRAAAAGKEFAVTAPRPPILGSPPKTKIESVRVLAGPGSKLVGFLVELGVSVKETSLDLVLDGANPPGPEAKPVIESALASGRMIMVWGIDRKGLSGLNALLPRPLDLTPRVATSLNAASGDLTAGLSPASLYFSEIGSVSILNGGLGGPLMEKATVLLKASDTDWRRWNNQGETVKTAMILRSEREAKPGGAALAFTGFGGMQLILSSLALSDTAQATAMSRTIFRNLGIYLGDGLGPKNVLGLNGAVPHILSAGPFPEDSVDAALHHNRVRDEEAVVDGQPWLRLLSDGEGRFPFRQQAGASAAYASFWVYSPKSLDNLLLDPHLPTVGLLVDAVAGFQVWVGGKELTGPSSPLLFQTGWNHVLVKLVRDGSSLVNPSLRLTTNQPGFLGQLRISTTKP